MPDPSSDFASFVKKATDFAMGSWWLGGTHYVPNTNFMGEVGFVAYRTCQLRTMGINFLKSISRHTAH